MKHLHIEMKQAIWKQSGPPVSSKSVDKDKQQTWQLRCAWKAKISLFYFNDFAMCVHVVW